MRAKQIIWIAFACILGAGIFWWTTVKNRVIKNAVTNVVQKKTDSLYKLSYDTAIFDEVGGNAYLYNVKLTLDPDEWAKLVQKDSMPPVTVDLQIDKITIQGLKELKLLGNRSLDVTAIILDKPVFRLERWLRKKPPAETLNDTVEIYKRLTGQFDFLRAKRIEVNNGSLKLLNHPRHDSVSASGVNVSIDDFLVDSTHNYRNIVSYFIKQSRASLSVFTSPTLSTGNILFDSRRHILEVRNLSFQDKGTRGKIPVLTAEGLSAEAYVYKNEIKARKLSISNPDITIVTGGKSKTTVIPSGVIDSLAIQNAGLSYRSEGKPAVVIRQANLLVKNVSTEHGLLMIDGFLNKENTRFSIGSVNMSTGIHRLKLTGITYPGNSDILAIQSLAMEPAITRGQLKTRIRKQADMYTIQAKHIVLEKCNLAGMIRDTVSIGSVNLEVNLHVFDDKTLPVDSAKKGRGLFPFDKIRMSKTAIDIQTIYAAHSSIVYEEQAPKSQMNGFIRFEDVTGKVTNVTNMNSRIAKDNLLRVEAGARIMGKAALLSQWSIPLDKTDGSFKITGRVGPFSIPLLNPAFEPLSMASIRSGEAERMDFEINGNHEGSKGTVLFKYKDLKIDLLRKNKQDSLQKKGFLSLVANAAVRNKNESDKARDYKFTKDRYKSLFNLLWNSIFAGAKETILILK